MHPRPPCPPPQISSPLISSLVLPAACLSSACRSTLDRGRFSYMGGKGGSLWQLFTYKQAPPPPTPSFLEPVAAPATPPIHSSIDSRGVASSSGSPSSLAASSSNSSSQAPCSGIHPASTSTPPCTGILTRQDVLGRRSQQPCSSFLSFLDEQLRQLRLAITAEAAAGLPFNLWGGLVGYLGYELKAECGGANVHSSPYPDAAFFLADQLLAIDQLHGDVYVLSLSNGTDTGRHEAELWVQQTAQRLDEMMQASSSPAESPSTPPPPAADCGCDPGGAGATPAPLLYDGCGHASIEGLGQGQGPAPQHRHCSTADCCPPLPTPSPLPFRLKHHRQRYIDNIVACHHALNEGESYEVCLTTALMRAHRPDPVQLYKSLRKLNPAPYAAWVCFGADGESLQFGTQAKLLICVCLRLPSPPAGVKGMGGLPAQALMPTISLE